MRVRRGYVIRRVSASRNRNNDTPRAPSEKRRVAQHAVCTHFEEPLTLPIEQLVFLIQEFLQNFHALPAVNAVPIQPLSENLAYRRSGRTLKAGQ